MKSFLTSDAERHPRECGDPINRHIFNWIPAYAGMTKVFPISRFTIHGNSMLPTLKPGQDVLCFNWAYIFSRPKIGDIVVIRYQGKEMIKRIQMYHGRGIFVTGDNKKESTDSRNFGAIDKSDIIGKVIFIR